MPKIAYYGAMVPPGRESKVIITPNIMTSEENIGDISVQKRQCYFTSERYLRYYRTYTQKSCVRECEANFTLAYCGCVLYYMPSKYLKFSSCPRK
jgi:amiloride-sensitive sodium channel